MQPEIQAFIDPVSGARAYLVIDPATGLCAIVDPVLGGGPGAATTEQMDALLTTIRARDLGPTWILLTAIDGDRLSAAGQLKYETGASTCIAAGVVDTIARLAPLAGVDDADPYGYDFDKLADGQEPLPLGALQIDVIALPGRTSESVAYRIGPAVFIGAGLQTPTLPSGGDLGRQQQDLDRLFAYLPQDARLYAVDGEHTIASAPKTLAPSPAASAVTNVQAANLRINLKAGRP